jgi:peptidoglycan hydrolase-like protein with peptidoglycan-binding domain
MIDQGLRAKRSLAPAHRGRELFGAIAVVVAATVGIVAVAQAGGSSDDPAAGAALVADDSDAGASGSNDPTVAATDVVDTTIAGTADPATASTAVGAPAAGLRDLDGVELTDTEDCTIGLDTLRVGASGPSVTCLQAALASAGLYDGAQTGEFDNATFAAVRQAQEERDLFVDGVVGRETAISLGVWPDEESFVVRTPQPPAGAVDLMGYPLSSVASAGSDAPPLPENSGSGRRIVYERAGQRVWAVGKDGSIIRSWLVSGSKYSNETPGTHEVYSRSDMSTAWNGKAWLPQMVRYLRTDIGHIGFHAIPLHVEDDSPYQTEAELGTRLSGGCQRQANRDAAFLWDFAQVGTTVVVV